MYYRKHNSSSLLITTHPRIPTLIEIIPLLSVYSASSRYIFPIKRLITGKVYPNPGHCEGSVRTKPSPVCPHLGSVRSQSKNFLDWTWTGLDGSGLDWSIAGLVESLPTATISSTSRPPRCLPLFSKLFELIYSSVRYSTFDRHSKSWKTQSIPQPTFIK
jgi:hypothetical protein